LDWGNATRRNQWPSREPTSRLGLGGGPQDNVPAILTNRMTNAKRKKKEKNSRAWKKVSGQSVESQPCRRKDNRSGHMPTERSWRMGQGEKRKNGSKVTKNRKLRKRFFVRKRGGTSWAHEKELDRRRRLLERDPKMTLMKVSIEMWCTDAMMRDIK